MFNMISCRGRGDRRGREGEKEKMKCSCGDHRLAVHGWSIEIDFWSSAVSDRHLVLSPLSIVVNHLRFACLPTNHRYTGVYHLSSPLSCRSFTHTHSNLNETDKWLIVKWIPAVKRYFNLLTWHRLDRLLYQHRRFHISIQSPVMRWF